MESTKRLAVYQKQNGGSLLSPITPKQRRRYMKKLRREQQRKYQ